MRLVKIKVFPESKKNKLSKKGPDSFDVSVRAEARNGEANKAAIILMAREFKIDSSRFKIIKGSRSHNKIIEIRE